MKQPTTSVTRRDFELDIVPARASHWGLLTGLFGARGACGGCWCMYWRKQHAAFERDKGERNRRDLERLIRADRPPGLLAISRRTPVGWCAVGPRSAFPRLARSRNLAPVDDLGVWSLPCFFVRRDWRRRGVATRLVAAGLAHARGLGAPSIEAYPVNPTGQAYPDTFAFTGFAKQFRRLGFREVARRAPTRPIMRFTPTSGASATRSDRE